MQTNDERREIAAMLRDMCIYGCSWKEEFYDLLGEAVMDESSVYEFSDVADRLADLIEPEPERTCCNVGGEEWGFKCSECGGHTHGSPFHVPDEEREELAEMLGGRIMSLHGSVPRFCPACGARVVDDHA